MSTNILIFEYSNIRIFWASNIYLYSDLLHFRHSNIFEYSLKAPNIFEYFLCIFCFTKGVKKGHRTKNIYYKNKFTNKQITILL